MDPQHGTAGGPANALPAGSGGLAIADPADGPGLAGADDSFGFGAAASWTLSGELPSGADLGGVTILRLLAEGGMGRVYEAVQERPRRTVAVKVIREGVVPATASDRLLREAETLAALRHPHIAQIHTCGTAPPSYGGVLFLVMELVDGARSITRFATCRGLAVQPRVALFRKVCDAVAHGHRHGVVHRDLKPANILVDAGGEPKVIDYGIARADVSVAGDGPVASATAPGHATMTGEVVGTLRYISPEQLLTPGDVPDARSDVYALGLVLHELLTGRLPYELGGKSVAEAARLLGGIAAPATAVVERQAAAEMARDDARALAVIVATCLEPLSADRYAHAGELVADLDRWLAGRPIIARPPTTLESLRRIARRHRLAFSAITALAITLVVCVVAVSLLSLRLERRRQEARAAEVRAESGAAAAREELYASTVLLAAAARDRGNVVEARRRLQDARGLVPPDAGPAPVELACLGASLDDAVATFAGDGGEVTAVAWAPDGEWLVSGDRAGGVRLWAEDGSTETARMLWRAEESVWSIAVAPDGRRVAAAARDGTVAVLDVQSDAPPQRINGGDAVYAVAFSPDGSRIATGSRDRSARIWDVATGREIRALPGHEGTVYAVAFSPDGTALATAAHDGVVRVWNLASGRLACALPGHEARVFSLSFAPDGRLLASASEDGTARIWNLAAEAEMRCLRHHGRVNAVAFDAAGGRVATAAGDGVIRIWNVEDGTETGAFRGHGEAAWSVAWSRVRDRIASGGSAGDVRIWDPAGRPDVLAGSGRVLSVAYSPDGGCLAAGLDEAGIALWDAATLESRGTLAAAVGRVHSVGWSPTGDLVAAGCDDGAVCVWEVTSRDRIVAVKPHTRRVYCAAFSPDGTRVATAAEDRTVSVRDPRTGEPAGPVLRHPRRVFCVAFTGDGSRIATACEDRMVRFWDAVTGAERACLSGHDGPVNWLALSSDGARLATASSDGTVRLWRCEDHACERILGGPATQVWKVAFSPDGTRVAAAAADGSVHLWDAESGRPLLALEGHRDQVWSVAFAPDGRSLASGSWDGTARVWGVAPAEIARRRDAMGLRDAARKIPGLGVTSP